MFIFGAGDLYAVPLFDANGNAIVSGTPVRVLTMQEMSLDFDGEIKELYGQKTFAAAIARGKTKLGGKVKGATINGVALNTLFFGQSLTTGSQHDVFVDNVGQAIPATPYTITPVPPLSGTFVDDLGVTTGAGVPFLKLTTGTPTTGQYVFNAGVYTFAAADIGTVVFISYHFSAAVAGAKRIQISNLTMGAAPAFKCFMRNTFQGKKSLSIIYSAVASKLMYLATKLDDFNIPEFDFSGQDDGAGNVADIYVQE